MDQRRTGITKIHKSSPPPQAPKTIVKTPGQSLKPGLNYRQLPKTTPMKAMTAPQPGLLPRSPAHASAFPSTKGLVGSRVDSQTLGRISQFEDAASRTQESRNINELKKTQDLQQFGAARNGLPGRVRDMSVQDPRDSDGDGVNDSSPAPDTGGGGQATQANEYASKGSDNCNWNPLWGRCMNKQQTVKQRTDEMTTQPSKADEGEGISGPVVGPIAVTNEDEFHSGGIGGGRKGSVRDWATDPPEEGAEIEEIVPRPGGQGLY